LHIHIYIPERKEAKETVDWIVYIYRIIVIVIVVIYATDADADFDIDADVAATDGVAAASKCSMRLYCQ